MNKTYGFLIGSIIVFVLFTLALFPNHVPPDLPRERLLSLPPGSVVKMEIYDAPTGKTIQLTKRDGLWYFGEKQLLDSYIHELLALLPELDALVSEQTSSAQTESARFQLTLWTDREEALQLTVGQRVDKVFSLAWVSQSSEIYLLDEYSLWRIRDLLNQAFMADPLFRSLLH